jgi:hypothetical protein
MGSTEAAAGSSKPVLPAGPRITQTSYLTKSSPLVDLRLKVGRGPLTFRLCSSQAALHVAAA